MLWDSQNRIVDMPRLRASPTLPKVLPRKAQRYVGVDASQQDTYVTVFVTLFLYSWDPIGLVLVVSVLLPPL